MFKINNKKIVVIVVILLSIFMVNLLSACTLTMGYRSNERQPLINKKPDNSGLYKSLYSLAAMELGCTLKIVRGPKKRILKLLKLGRIDFYPGFNLTTKRAESFFYMVNGLPGGDMGVSRADLPNITSLEQLKGKTLLTSSGAPDFLQGIKGVNIHNVKEMNIKKAFYMLKINRGDFYIYNKSSLDYYIKKFNIDNIKKHPDCCGGVLPLYLAFSKKSPLIDESKNSHYDHFKPISTTNFPTVLNPSSLAYKFQSILLKMSKDGVTQDLYDKFYQ